ncbi:MAG: 3'(2'),5'-bisphosphate nucleotidase CysQ [Proteobacteria bacterium]|nr:3'(2'),5'-bisphosphate nucleotidase CysQ [Pseudomonadota bacterium]
MDAPELKKILHAVEGIAQEAGAEIMKHYAGTAIYTKDDGSLVTDADHASEKIILSRLQKLTPDIPIVSEERSAAGDVPDVTAGTFWTVDPLDGTQEFVDKTGGFVVAIALIVDHTPVMGILYHPVTGVTYSGMGPGTATKVDAAGTRMPITAGAAPSGDLHVLVKNNADIKGIRGYLTHQFNKAASIDEMGGAILASQIADSSADMAVVFPLRRNGRTKWWDVAPGQALVEATGGRVEDLDGKPLVYDANDLQVPPHVMMAPHQARAVVSKPSQNRP